MKCGLCDFCTRMTGQCPFPKAAAVLNASFSHVYIDNMDVICTRYIERTGDHCGSQGWQYGIPGKSGWDWMIAWHRDNDNLCAMYLPIPEPEVRL